MGYPVVDAVGSMQGFVTREDLLTYMVNNEGKATTVRELIHYPTSVAFPDEPVRVAADRMAQNNQESIPVVDPNDPQRVLGLVSREDLFNARILWFENERKRERFLTIPRPNTKVLSIFKNKKSITNKTKENGSKHAE